MILLKKVNFSILKIFVSAIFLYLFLIILFYYLNIFNYSNEQSSLVFLHLSSIISFYYFWKKINWGTAKYDSFGSLIILISIIFRITSIIDTVFFNTRFDAWPPFVTIQSSLLFLHYKGEFITQLGILLMVSTWRISVNKLINHFSLSNILNYFISHDFKILYIFGLLFILIIKIFKINSIILEQLFYVINISTIASIYFILLLNNNLNKYAKLLFAFLLALPLFILSLNTGSKETMFLPLIPLLLIYIKYFKNLFSRITLLISIVVIISISQLYIVIVRQLTWADNVSISTKDLINGTFENFDSDLFFLGIEQISLRINPTLSHAITVGIEERDGILPKDIFYKIPYSFIPRIIWPNKPKILTGAEHTQRILQSNKDISEISTSTPAGFFTELYLGGGIAGLIFFSIFYGFLICKIQINILFKFPIEANFIYIFYVLYNSIRFDEFTISYAITGSILFYLNFMLLFIILFLFKKLFKNMNLNLIKSI